MLAEVHLRNKIALYRDLNAKRYGVAATPEVGIFWMGRSGKALHKKSVSLREAGSYGEFKTYDGSHHLEWAAATCAFPQWQGMEYEDLPRGRVVYFTSPGENRFIVYIPRVLRRHESKILTAFMLPPGHTQFDYANEHYRV